MRRIQGYLERASGADFSAFGRMKLPLNRIQKVGFRCARLRGSLALPVLKLTLILMVVGCGVGGEDPPVAAGQGVAGVPSSGDYRDVAKHHPAFEASSPELTDLRTRRTGDDWPTFLGPSRDSKSTERGILTDWPKAGPPFVWATRTGTSYAMPVTSLGRLFQFARFGDKARVTCHRSETGEELWQYEYPTDFEDLYGYDNGPRCCPVVDGERVYTFGAEGVLHCLRTVDGEPLWSVDTAAAFGVVQNFFGVGSTPIVAGDLLIVQVGGSPAEDQAVPPGQLDQVSGNGTGVVAFDKRTGEVVYHVSDELASYSSPTLATIDGRELAFLFARGGLLGFSPESGNVSFHFPWRAEILESVNASSPVVVGDRVFISETYGPGSALLRVKTDGYEVVWSDAEARRGKKMQTHWNTAVHHEGYLYGSSGRHPNDAELRAIELKTGKVAWSEPGLARSSLLYADGHFICLTEYGQLILLKANPERFEPLAVAVPMFRPTASDGQLSDPVPLLANPCWAAPILSHGLLYVRGAGRIACFELIPDNDSP